MKTTGKQFPSSNHVSLAAAMAGAVLLVGCTPVGVTGPQVPTVHFYDAEPNDDSSQPQPIGPVYPPERVVIAGHVNAFFGFHHDPTDAYAMAAYDPARIHFSLVAQHHGADLDLCLVDPFLEQVVAHWESFGDEYGAFDVPGAGQEFHLVVVAFSGASAYELVLDVDPLPYGSPVPLAPRALPGDEGSGATVDAERAARLEPYFDGARKERRREAERLAVEHVMATLKERNTPLQ